MSGQAQASIDLGIIEIELDPANSIFLSKFELISESARIQRDDRSDRHKKSLQLAVVVILLIVWCSLAACEIS